MQKHIFFQSAFTSSVLKELSLNLLSFFYFFFSKGLLKKKNNNNNNLHLFPVYLGKAHLRGLDVLQSGRRRTCKHRGKGEATRTARVAGVSGRKRTDPVVFSSRLRKWTCQRGWFLGRGACLPSISPSSSPRRIRWGKAVDLQVERRGCFLFPSDVAWASSGGEPKVNLWKLLVNFCSFFYC